jgi:hypothetical protein
VKCKSYIAFFSRLKPSKFCFIDFVVKKLVTLIRKGVGDG